MVDIIDDGYRCSCGFTTMNREVYLEHKRREREDRRRYERDLYR